MNQTLFSVVKTDAKRFLNALILTALAFLFISGCQPKSELLRPALQQDEGELHIYLAAFPQEADKLKFALLEISAVQADGTPFPLSLSFSEFNRAANNRQRFVASGRLPSGRYTGISFRIKEAFLEGEEGEVALLVPDGAVRVEFPFQVRKKKAALLSLALNYRDSLMNRFRFSPAFSINVPDMPITDLMGLVANYRSNNITVFNKKSMQVVGVIATGRGPKGIALDQLLKRAYVALSGEDTVEVVDLSSGEITERLRLRTGDSPQEPALTPDRRLILTANTGSDTVSMIDAASLVEVNRIPVGKGPKSVAIDPRGSRAFVFNALSNTISVINIPNQAVETELSTESGPTRGQFNRSGDRLFVIHEQLPYLTVIDPIALTRLQRVFIGWEISALKVDTNMGLLYIGQKHRTVVEVYNPLSFLPVDSIQCGGSATHMMIDGAENNLHIVIPENRAVVAVRIVSRKIVSAIDVGEGPYWVALMGGR